MSDVVKCEAEDCPLKETCFRYTRHPNEDYQAYLIPLDYLTGECDDYWNDDIII